MDRLRSDNAPRNCTGALWGLSAETNANGACITLYKDGGDVISTFYLAFDSFIICFKLLIKLICNFTLSTRNNLIIFLEFCFLLKFFFYFLLCFNAYYFISVSLGKKFIVLFCYSKFIYLFFFNLLLVVTNHQFVVVLLY